LPQSQRVPLVLYHFEDFSYEEIAAKLNISLAKVKTDIFRAREALRKKLKITIEGGESWQVEATPSHARREEKRSSFMNDNIGVFSVHLA
jgi:hypothetical protein